MQKSIHLVVAVCMLAAITAGCDKGQSSSDEEPVDTPADREADVATDDTAQTDASAESDGAEGSEESAGAAGVEVVPLDHGSFLLEWEGDVIAVDPVSDALEAAGEEVSEVDLVLLTDIHPDHLDADAVSQVRGEGAPVVAPQAVVDEAGDDLAETTVMENGDTESFFDGALSVEATPMYNIERTNPDTGEPFHEKGRGNGYLLERDDTRVYISGDTECTPEMKELDDIDVALVTMNVPYTMPVDEAAECIREFRPAVVYPFHYKGEDPAELHDLLADVDDVEVRLLDWYPDEEGDDE